MPYLQVSYFFPMCTGLIIPPLYLFTSEDKGARSQTHSKKLPATNTGCHPFSAMKRNRGELSFHALDAKTAAALILKY